jgi:large subunit ribosomal protein L25
MLTLAISGTRRDEVGKKAAKAVKRAGLVPCVLYSRGKENVHFTVHPHDLRDLIYTKDFKLANLTVDGKSHRCIIKSVTFHPVKDTPEHIDFLELQDGHPIKVEVPLRFEGVSPGVRNGGKFAQSVRRIKIKATPELLVDEVVANISKLKLGESIRVRDIKVVEGVEIMNPGALPVAMVQIPRSLKGAGAIEEEEEGGEGAAEEAGEE